MTQLFLTDDQKASAQRIVDDLLPIRMRSDGQQDVATQAERASLLRGARAAIIAGGYVQDLTCIVRRKRRWFDPRNVGDSTVICGRATVEQYLRQGYTFDWPATDSARAKAMEARQGRDGEAGSVADDSAVPKGFAQGDAP